MGIRCVNFSTEGFSCKYSKEIIQATFSGVASITYRDERCFMDLTCWMAEQFFIQKMLVSPITVKRTRKMIAKNDIDRYRIRICLSGATNISTSYGEYTAHSGAISILDLGQPTEIRGYATSAIFIDIPRDLLHSMVHPAIAGQFHGLLLREDSIMTSMLHSHLLALVSLLPRAHAHDIASIRNSTLSLLTGAILNSVGAAGATASSHSLALAVQIKAHIVEHISNPELNAAQLMKHFKLSRSSLYEFFQAYSGVSNYIRNIRLRRARMALTDPLQDHRTIGEIAFACGFNNESHFCRVFRRAFGTSPGEARKTRACPYNCRQAAHGNDPLVTARVINRWHFDSEDIPHPQCQGG